MFLGEIISIAVCVCWSASALFGQVAARGIGHAMPLNVMRMALSLILLSLSMIWVCGVPYPMYADRETWMWLTLSGLMGYVLGDFCLFNAYIVIGARFGQLFMTLAPPAAALSGWILLGEKMSLMALLGMTITVSGISMSILGKKTEDNQRHLQLPVKGILYGIGAGVGQGVGLVLSKLGIEHYEECIKSTLADNPLQMNSMLEAMPMSATFIRAITGIICFTIAMFYVHQQGTLLKSMKQGRLMFIVLLATITGPFVGVSLSLKATLYTSTGIAQTIMACTPILVLWPSHFFFKQEVTLREIIGAIISVIGVALFFV